MTNETTASQPKSIGDDALSEFIEEYEWRTDDFCHKPTEAERLMLLDFAVNLDDSRAPAPQASATIQAAPEGWKLVPLEPSNKMTAIGQDLRYVSVNSIGEIYRRMIDAAPAATIQEPVMVAEQVALPPNYTCIGKGGSYALVGTARGAGQARLHKDLVIYRDNATCNLYFRTKEDFSERMTPLSSSDTLAAPMVADPAGVALLEHDYQIEELFKAHQGRWVDNSYWQIEDADFHPFVRAVLHLAATVKAVPSEAPAEPIGWRLKKEGADYGITSYDKEQSEQYIRSDGWVLVQELFAAPLADKTGRGE